MCWRYVFGWPTTLIGKIHDRNSETVNRVLRRNNIEIRKISEYKKYAIDDSVFEQPLSNDAVYWFGMLIADGSITQKKTRLKLLLQYGDVEHIEEFCGFLKTQRPLSIERYRKDIQAGVVISNVKICSDLYSAGMIPNKKYNAFEICDEILENRNFWRGAVDGDGCVRIACEKKRRRPHISLSGQKYLMEKFLQYVMCCLNVSTKTRVHPHGSHNGITYCVSFHGKVAYAIISNLYGHEHKYSLERKQKCANEILLEFKKYKGFPPDSSFCPKGSSNGLSVLTEQDVIKIRAMKDSGYSGKSIATMFGVTGANISAICKRKTWKHI